MALLFGDIRDEIGANLEDLKQILSSISPPSPPITHDKQQVLVKVETCIERFITDMAAGRWPQSSVYDGRNTKVVAVGRPRQQRKSLLLVYLLAKVHRLLRTNTTSTKRDLYYEDVSLWTNQLVLDETVVTLTRLLNVPRHCVNISATSKGLVSGSVSFLDSAGRLVNCSSSENGHLIPNDVDALSGFQTRARCILVIEKDSTFQKLIDDDVERYIGPCILITGKGYPDVATRRFLVRLYREFQLPPLALVDADPHGICIMAVYRFGSQNLEDIERLAVPQLRWIGLHPSDIESLRLPDQSRLPLTDRDRSLVDSMAKRTVQQPLLHQQLMILKRLNCKAEIQGLTKLPAAHHFLTRTYLPSKLRTGCWL